MGETFRRRRKIEVRLAERQIWSVKIIPSVLGKMLQDKDAGKTKRVMNEPEFKTLMNQALRRH